MILPRSCARCGTDVNNDRHPTRVVAAILPRYPKCVSKVFLTAEWRNLVMLNYEVDAGVLRRFVPDGTYLDVWQGRTFVSLVGFRFLNTKVFGLSFPFHSNFEEVNLRFYVQRRTGQELRRGVVFIREIVPRWAIARIARVFYNEKYLSLPMSHRIDRSSEASITTEYCWRFGGCSNRICIHASGAPTLPEPASHEQFIAEHHWGYTAQPDGGCMEYRVGHPPWRVWKAHHAAFEGNIDGLYGAEFATVFSKKPSSAFLAEGSQVVVYRGSRL